VPAPSNAYVSVNVPGNSYIVVIDSSTSGSQFYAGAESNYTVVGSTSANTLQIHTNGSKKVVFSTSTHVEYSGTVPTVGSGVGDCGSSPSIVGNDSVGRVTVGSGVNGGKCTITFNDTNWTNIPICDVQDETTGNLVRAGNVSKTSFEITGTLIAGDTLTYSCSSYQ
jgi:hypothetical protein